MFLGGKKHWGGEGGPESERLREKFPRRKSKEGESRGKMEWKEYNLEWNKVQAFTSDTECCPERSELIAGRLLWLHSALLKFSFFGWEYRG